MQRKVNRASSVIYLGLSYYHQAFSAYKGKTVDIHMNSDGLAASYNGHQIAYGIKPVIILESLGSQGGLS
jgi:hypothetical protein